MLGPAQRGETITMDEVGAWIDQSQTPRWWDYMPITANTGP